MIVVGIDHCAILAQSQLHANFLAAHLNDVRTADQNGALGGFFQNGLRGAQDTFVLAFGEYNAALRGGGSLKDWTHQHGRAEDIAIKLCFISLKILNRARGDPALHRCAGDGGGHNTRQTRIKGFWDQILWPKGQALALIGCGGLGRGAGARQLCNCLDTGDLHSIIDFRRPHIQRAAENERKAQDVINLVGKITAPCGDDRLGILRAGEIGHDFRRWIGEGKYNGPISHFADHLRFENTWPRQAQKDVGPVNHII